MTIRTRPLKVAIHPIRLPESGSAPVTALIPAVRGCGLLRYGRHAIYALNFKTHQGLRIGISHRAIIQPGLACFKAAAGGVSWPTLLARRYHYGFSLLEEIMMMTVPHTVTPITRGHFLVNLWAWPGYLDVDLRARSVVYRLLETPDTVFGAGQWHDASSGMLYGMTFSLKDAFARIGNPQADVAAELMRRQPGEGKTETVWQGPLADFMHELTINRTGRYAVACELGMARDTQNTIIPSRVLIVDLVSGRHWRLDRFIVAAHAQFDPDDPDVIYFSNHNFQFVPSRLCALLKRATYGIRFEGPASVWKYRLTPDGPQEIGVFTRSDFFRLTNMHICRHRGRKLLAAMGFPDDIFLVDADTMSFVRTIKVSDPKSLWHPGSHHQTLIGTITPTPDGERLLAHTTRALHSIDIASGSSEIILDHPCLHTCSNHMIALSDTDW